MLAKSSHPDARITARRMQAQGLTPASSSAPESSSAPAPASGNPAEIVGRLVAVQAQDLAASKWAVGLRLGEGATEARVEAALAEGALLRTHVMRGTWQLVTPADVRWLLDLVAPRLIAMAKGSDRRLGFDAGTYRRSRAALEKALRDGAHLTREELGDELARVGIPVGGMTLSHVLQRAELQGAICSGRPRDGQETFALLDLRAPSARPPCPREEALAELALRYFASRGPATVADFAWWAGLTMTDARAGLADARRGLVAEELAGETFWSAEGSAEGDAGHRARGPSVDGPSTGIHLLPAFDEYVVGYKDRSAALATAHVKRVSTGGGNVRPTVVVDGRIVGVWRRTLGRRKVRVEVTPFGPLAEPTQRALATACEGYGRYLERPVELRI